MFKSTIELQGLLVDLTAAARQRRWSDAEWARRAGLPKETLCRLRSRANCDFETVRALAAAAGAQVGILQRQTASSVDGLWPAHVDRGYEARLIDALASGTTSPDAWRTLGPPFFLAGLAVMLASVSGLDRQAHLALAEALHPGASEPRVFQRWLAGTPLSPSRLLPALEHARRAA
jgi:hypothetical protein